jgi:LuxR family maltose regulon positive regulatory protein
MNPSSIAKVLHLSVHTVRGHVKSIHGKLGVSSQLEAVVKARRLGLLEGRDED